MNQSSQDYNYKTTCFSSHQITESISDIQYVLNIRERKKRTAKEIASVQKR